MRHKRILDVATDRPDASYEAIADEIPSASPDLVEDVLEQYGDPAEDEIDEEIGVAFDPRVYCTNREREQSTSPSPQPTRPDWSTLTEKQRETLVTIDEHPQATQKELGEIVGVSGATICARVNNIEGFDWENRHEFVADVIEPPQSTEETHTTDTMATNGEEQRLDSLADRMRSIEEKLTDSGGEHGGGGVISDPELAHKVMHACLQADTISEDEELQIVQALLR